MMVLMSMICGLPEVPTQSYELLAGPCNVYFQNPSLVLDCLFEG